MRNFFKIYNLLLEDTRKWEEYYVSRLGKNTFKNILNSNENDALKDSQELYKKFVNFGFKHNNRSKKLFKPAAQIIAGLILSGNSRNDLYKENGKVDKILSKLQEILNNSIFLTDFTKNPDNMWDYKKFENFISQMEQTNAEKLKKTIPTQNENYKLIPINSFEEFKERYGNGKTGYKGESEWCTVKNESYYNSYLKKSENANFNFFVIEKDGWENIIPPPNLTDEDLKQHNPYDEYGLSLICLVIDLEMLELKNVVLRWNHLGDFDIVKTGVPNKGSDNTFISYKDMSRVLGFDFKKELSKQIKIVKKFRKEEQLKVKKYRNFQGTFIEKLQDIANNPPYIIKKEYIENDNKPENQQYFENLKIPEGIKEIGKETFKKFDLKALELPNSLIKLNEGCFSECKNLESIEISDSVEELGEDCFEFCVKLESIKFPINPKFTKLPIGCFRGCEGLKLIKIPNSIENIMENCFAGCKSLESIKFPINSKFKEISFNCFCNCRNLKSIEIPDSVISLGIDCFESCSNLESIKLSKNLKYLPIHCFYNCWNLKSIEIPDSVEIIKKGCFSDCKSLEAIKLPKKLIKLSRSCFYNCRNLNSIEIPDSIISLEDFCFDTCKNLKTIKLPNKLEKIGDFCFTRCYSLKSIKIPDSVKEIGRDCFNSCENLETIKLSNNLIEIPYECFAYCDNLNLKLIEIPESIKTLHNLCFSSCSSLKKIIFLGNISNIGWNIFYGCLSLKEIVCAKESTYNKFKELNLENVKISLNKNVK